VTDVKDRSVEARDNDAVGGVQQFAHARGEGQERGEAVPGVLPDAGGLRVLTSEYERAG
jgi:hypothetical protein